VRLRVKKSLLAGFAAGVAALLALPSLSFAQEEVFQANLGQFIVKNGPLVSFDIGWVDPNLQASGTAFYFLADRSNAQVDSIPIEVNPPSFFFKNPAFPFAGNVLCPDGAANDCAGPNGVLTIFPDPEGQFELWVGDGPSINAFCPNPAVACSTVKVFQGFAGNLLRSSPPRRLGRPTPCFLAR
jgi:hypothetical protein